MTHIPPSKNPHVCEANRHRSGNCISNGTPPPTWGNARTVLPSPYPTWAIPTYVGLTCAFTTPATALASYPHVRGAYLVGCAHPRRAKELSPRRGATFSMQMPVPSGRGYPHVRGAYMAGYSASATVLELSPRAWGLRGRFFRNSAPAGAIPTCVGLTELGLIQSAPFRSYPHARGAYHEMIRVWIKKHELSPRVWGLPPLGFVLRSAVGVIPTCVGRT